MGGRGGVLGEFGQGADVGLLDEEAHQLRGFGLGKEGSLGVFPGPFGEYC